MGSHLDLFEVLLFPDGTTRYRYNTNKQLRNISSPGSISKTFRYDTKGRLLTETDTIPGSDTLRTLYSYDNLGRSKTITHPSGITESYVYNSGGYLSSISAGGAVRWEVNEMNARMQITSGEYKNNLSATFGYDEYGFPTSTATGTIQDYSYNFDTETGNLNWRQNNNFTNLREDFQYDDLDRLTNVQMDTTSTLDMTYDCNTGGITGKSDAGTFNYEISGKPYAISSIDPSMGLAPADTQTIAYTSFESISSISEGSFEANFIYNSDNERARMVAKQNGNTILTRWYTNSYIKENDGSNTKEYTFIGGDAYSAPAVAIRQNNATVYYSLLRDYLGNILQVVDSTNTPVVEYSFDAWGRMRNPATWVNYSPDSVPTLFVAGRGFTGHEHLPWFNSINMNGRVYDPLLAMFFSPDNYVQAPDYTQNFNRYGYCLNNPLKYSDPSGYTWLSNFGDWLGSTGKTIVTIAAAVAVAAAVACIPGLDAVGIAFVGGMLSGATSGGLGAALNGGDVFSGAVQSGIMGAATGLATLGITSAIGYGLNSTFPNFNGGGLWFHPESETLQGSLASMLPSFGSVINGVSNTALSSGIIGGSFGGVLSTSLFPRPTINPVYMSSRLEFSGQYAEHNGSQYINGCLNWVDIYSNGSTVNSGTWSAVSGPWKSPIAAGNHSIQYGNMGLNTGLPGYIRDGADFYIDIFPDPTYEIHPDGNLFGTNGCLGIQESGLNCLTLYKMIRRYTYRNCVLSLSVKY